MKRNIFDYNETYGCIGCLLVLFLYFGLALFVAWIVMLLWNWIVPLFWTSAPILNVWQSWGAIILLSLIAGIFKGNSKINIKE